MCRLDENYIFQVTCCLYYLAIAKWNTDSNKSADFLLNPVLYIIYVSKYMLEYKENKVKTKNNDWDATCVFKCSVI